jgi:hypothetical protein
MENEKDAYSRVNPSLGASITDLETSFTAIYGGHTGMDS